MLDIVIPVRAGAKNESLRYALRSFAANLPHDRVWLVGGKPSWARNVGHIRTAQSGTKYKNTTLAMRTACEHPGVSDEFIYANDDFYVLRPVDGDLPVYHKGPMADLERYLARKYARRRNPYLAGLRQTRDLLAKLGYQDPICYENHVPMPVSKAGMLKALDLGRGVPVLHKRTMYGVINGIGGTRLRDPKVLTLGRFPKDAPFLSTTANSFARGAVGQHIRRTFNTPCRYEAGGGR